MAGQNSLGFALHVWYSTSAAELADGMDLLVVNYLYNHSDSSVLLTAAL